MLAEFAITEGKKIRLCLLCRAKHKEGAKCGRPHEGDPRVRRIIQYQLEYRDDLRIKLRDYVKEFRRKYRRQTRELKSLRTRPCASEFIAWRDAAIAKLQAEIPAMDFSCIG